MQKQPQRRRRWSGQQSDRGGGGGGGGGDRGERKDKGSHAGAAEWVTESWKQI